MLVLDEVESRVHGIVTTDGIFEGKIQTPGELYVIERAKRYFKQQSTDPTHFHSVIYKQSAVRTDILNSSFCRSAELHQRLQRSLMNDDDDSSNNNDDYNTSSHRTDSFVGGGGESRARRNVRTAQGYPRPAARYDPDSFSNRYYFRQQLRQVDPTKTTCTMYIQADHLFYEKFDRNEETVVEQLTQHVQGVNEIYRQIGWFSHVTPQSALQAFMQRLSAWA